MKTAYACVRSFIKFVLRLYFYKIKIEGLENVPKGIPLLVTPNHQNALLDPLLVGAFIPIPLHYLTRSDVFNKRTRPIFRMLNMMPIYRIRDGYAKLSLNDGVFAACLEVFKQNESVLIFAEGNHGKEYFLRPLTKGAARVALQSQEAMDSDLMVLPVGLNFFEHQRPRSTVLIRFGEPVPVRQYLDTYTTDRSKGLIAMRDAISEAMKSVMILPDETLDYEARKKAIFQWKHESLSFQELQAIDPLHVDIDVKPQSKHRIARLLNPIPYFVIHRVVRRVDDMVFHPTLKFAIGVFAFPLWWLIVFFTMLGLVGINIALLAVIVMLFGLFYSYQR